MNRDVLLSVLLLVAIVEAAMLLRPRGETVAGVPLGGLAVAGEIVTVEDLARGCLALEEGELDAPRLSLSEKERLREQIATANAHRAELLAIEEQQQKREAELDAKARAIVATLTPEQWAWIRAHRNDVSVAQVEAAYWDKLQAELAP